MRALTFIFLAAVCGCTSDQSIGNISQHVIADPKKLDILFVMDRSSSMIEKQQEVATSLPLFVHQLESLPGGLPSLHIGVVTSDMGVGNVRFPAESCTAAGDAAELQSAPRIAGCSPPDGAFISDEIDAAGGRVRNYAGTLEDTLACIGRVGDDGCGFEQPLLAVTRALGGTVARNAGFVREDAFLTIVFITDEDDCSASDPAIFDQDPATFDPTDDGSFRCTRWGVECDGQILDHAGAYQGCVSRKDSPRITDVDDFVADLKAIKDERAIYVASLAGDPTPVAVVDDSGALALAQSCRSGTIDADPAVRLGQLGGAFAHHSFQSICSAAIPDVLGAVGGEVRQMIVSYPADKADDVSISYGCAVGGGGAGGGGLGLLVVAALLGGRVMLTACSRKRRSEGRCTGRATTTATRWR